MKQARIVKFFFYISDDIKSSALIFKKYFIFKFINTPDDDLESEVSPVKVPIKLHFIKNNWIELYV